MSESGPTQPIEPLPMWLQWTVLVAYNLVMATAFGGLMWLMIWYGSTYGF